MPIRLRKFIGVCLFVMGTTFYFLLAITIAFACLPGTSIPIQLLYYAGSTLIWFLLAAIVIKWSIKPAPSRPA